MFCRKSLNKCMQGFWYQESRFSSNQRKAGIANGSSGQPLKKSKNKPTLPGEAPLYREKHHSTRSRSQEGRLHHSTLPGEAQVYREQKLQAWSYIRPQTLPGESYILPGAKVQASFYIRPKTLPGEVYILPGVKFNQANKPDYKFYREKAFSTGRAGTAVTIKDKVGPPSCTAVATEQQTFNKQGGKSKSFRTSIKRGLLSSKGVRILERRTHN